MSELNRAFWDERVPLHVASDFYDLESFRAGRSSLHAFEIAEVGHLEGRTLVHLQCHFGLDTLSWARRGARVCGLDFSAPAIDAARSLAGELGIQADFVAADVLDAREALGGRRFHVVYTGRGALTWLPDIRHWAEVVAALVEPGGFLYLNEFHPFSWVFADEELAVQHDYFHHRLEFEEPGTYADPTAVTVSNRTEEWHHPLGDVVSSLIDAGLVLELLAEQDHTAFQRWPFLEKTGFDTYRFPAGRPRVPLMYSLRARRPAGV